MGLDGLVTCAVGSRACGVRRNTRRTPIADDPVACRTGGLHVRGAEAASTIQVQGGTSGATGRTGSPLPKSGTDVLPITKICDPALSSISAVGGVEPNAASDAGVPIWLVLSSRGSLRTAGASIATTRTGTVLTARRTSDAAP